MKMHYRTLGQGGEQLIILHGLLGMSDNWLPIARLLAQEREIFLPDWRNHGLSPHSPLHTYPLLCEDLKSFLDEKKIKNVVLAGHSMGGKAACLFAGKYPEYVKRLIVLDILPVHYEINLTDEKRFAEYEKILKFMADFPVEKYSDRKVICAEIDDRFSDLFTIQMIQKNLLRTRDGFFRWKINAPVLLHGLTDIAGDVPIVESGFNVETLFVFGDRSPYFRQEVYSYIEHLPQAEIEVIENAGHALHVDQKEKLAECMLQFMDKNKT